MEAYLLLDNIGKRSGLIEEERIEGVVDALCRELKRAFGEVKKKTPQKGEDKVEMKGRIVSLTMAKIIRSAKIHFCKGDST